MKNANKLTSAQLREQLATAKDMLKKAKAKLERLEAETEKTKEEIKKWGGGGWGSRASRGLVGDLEYELKLALIREKDEKAIRVVWVEGTHSEWDEDSEPWIVDKVAPKTIFIRRFGSDNGREPFNLDGTRRTSYPRDRIDLVATFGEGGPR